MEARALNKSIIVLVFLLCTGFFFKKKQEPIPLVQRGIINQAQAIIYEHPDFDSKQMMTIPKNKVVAISTEIYRPKNLFGSFYRVFITKKNRGYISEVDIIPQYKKHKKGWSLNFEYQKKEVHLKKVQSKSNIFQPQSIKKK